MKCEQYEEWLPAYIECDLSKEEELLLEEHLKNCESCKQELSFFQEIIGEIKVENNDIRVPRDFMTNVRKKVTKTTKGKKRKTRLAAFSGAVASIILVASVGTVVANDGLKSFMDWWKDNSTSENEQVERLVQSGLSDEVNIEAISNGVKMKITNVAADDIQTFIYYEVEDLEGENRYMVDISSGLEVLRKDKKWFAHGAFSSLSLYSEENNVYKGRIALKPVDGLINLRINKLDKFNPIQDEKNDRTDLKDTEYIEGDWQFEIPVKKHAAIEYKLNKEVEVEGNQVVFNKLVIAPTVTTLSYVFMDGNPNRQVSFIQIDSIESNGKFAYNDLLLGAGNDLDYDSVSSELAFETLYFDQPKEIRIHIGPIMYYETYRAEYPIDPYKSDPQIFEYLGNQISIKDIEINNSTKLTLNENFAVDRPYERLDFTFLDKEGNRPSGSAISEEGKVVDKNKSVYESKDFYMLKHLERPKLYAVVNHIENHTDSPDKPFIPAKLVIDGYFQTEYPDQYIDIKLEDPK
ncbi:DUF4179 domain-containing protein [Cytobacillus purgationiresistens]|uniref:Anti-sigma-W factor RsiW n=1 Tax=Cytobacillus purgationiresistens TaxID=863449 RepID=A0ABU0APS4_9BACI|nr:DUF4179 domain-containing protein [Cytobacillus purgationiresistens]MDQ0272854.1 hypothetical protein [Cytobacillus purgationiresistens]